MFRSIVSQIHERVHLDSKKGKAMKCFSVHMKIGVIEGIRLAPPHYNHLMIGSFAYGYTVFRMHPMRRGKRLPVMLNASIQWTSRMSSPQTIEGLPIRIRTKHIIHPYSGGNDDCKALVMLGTYRNDYRIVYINDPCRIHERPNRKIDPVFEIGSGAYGAPWIRSLVLQKLCIMKPKSYIILVSKDQTRANKCIHWDGFSLRMYSGVSPIVTLA